MFQIPLPDWFDAIPQWLQGPFEDAMRTIYFAGFRDGAVVASIAAVVLVLVVSALRKPHQS